METTRVSEQGHVLVPQTMRNAYGWEAGQELLLIDTGEGILLKPKKPFAETTLSDVAGCLKSSRGSKSIEAMDDAIRRGIEEEWHGRS
ncbi:MAG TPA: AbrB/MazE/SpoVT family DNA-binding domain-containing protein [Leptolyngbyaceae cyanobacterium M33_DOE_097]|uniref:AbrB family transcriptional regulator n=1 Tax=Oscillatoriales cyanobacterium SpSt-418 TaxID=2282169 RepID=A0A7C3PI63_9CYAN|nr:AbrB/MazE/SpoVT family DNA-binding domain-containing protein [Leptolyngbyaceae cyanobacterium M33_DOE_097]